MHLEAAKLATYHAASLYDRSSPNHPKHDPSITSHAVGVACNSAKYLAAEAAFTACERSVMSMGGMGYAAEYHVERYMRECFVPRIAPVSRVSTYSVLPSIPTVLLTIETGNDHELRWRESVEVATKLLVNVYRYTNFMIGTDSILDHTTHRKKRQSRYPHNIAIQLSRYTIHFLQRFAFDHTSSIVKIIDS